MRISFGGWAAQAAVAYELKGHFFVVAAGGSGAMPAHRLADAFAAALADQDREATPSAQLASLIQAARAHPGWADAGARGVVAWVDLREAWVGRIGPARSFRWRYGRLDPVAEGEGARAAVTRVSVEPGDVLVLVCEGEGAVDAVGLVTVRG